MNPPNQRLCLTAFLLTGRYLGLEICIEVMISQRFVKQSVQMVFSADLFRNRSLIKAADMLFFPQSAGMHCLIHGLTDLVIILHPVGSYRKFQAVFSKAVSYSVIDVRFHSANPLLNFTIHRFIQQQKEMIHAASRCQFLRLHHFLEFLINKNQRFISVLLAPAFVNIPEILHIQINHRISALFFLFQKLPCCS